MVAFAKGEIWWADLSEPAGSEPRLRRPVVVVQGDPLNRSRISTVVVVPLTSNLQWSEAPGNVLLSAAATGLPQDSVVNVSRIVAVDRRALTERISRFSPGKLNLIHHQQRVGAGELEDTDDLSPLRVALKHVVLKHQDLLVGEH
jgi:mRNA interferase MazF